MAHTLPSFASTAFREIPHPDFADVAVVPLPPGTPADPAVWAREIFARRAVPPWGKALFVARQALVPLIGVGRGDRDVFRVREVVGEEALIAADDRHLDWRCAVGVDPDAGLVRLTTAVRLHGVRGRVYFTPVRVVHPLMVHAMLTRAARHLGRRAAEGG